MAKEKLVKAAKYGYSADGEMFHDTYDSREAALEVARKRWPQLDVVYTCRCEFPVALDYARLPGMCGEDLATAIEEAANDDEYGCEDGPVFDLDQDELEAFMLDMLKAYLRVTRPKANCYLPADVTEHRQEGDVLKVKM